MRIARAPVGAHAPGLLVDLLHRQVPSVALRAQPVHVALVLADQVAPGRPDRDADVQRLRAARIDLQLHLDAARLGLGDAEDVGVHADAQS